MPATASVLDIEEIKSALGFPLEDELDWGDVPGGTDGYILKYVIPRVLRKYFTYYPIKFDYVQTVESVFEIPYPDLSANGLTVFGLLRYYMNYKRDFIGTFSNPFVLQQNVLSIGSTSGKTPFGSISEYYDRMTTSESVVDSMIAVRVEDHPEDRVLRGSSNIAGNLSIQFACMAEDFNRIRFQHKEDAITLAKAFFLQDSSRLREQLKIQGKIEINSSVLSTQAEAWEQAVLQRWQGRSNAIVVK
jgi:hypothetical protein